MLEICSKIVEKYDQKIFFDRFQWKNFGYESDDFKKKKFTFKKKTISIKKYFPFCFAGGFTPAPPSPTRAAPLLPAFFWIEYSSRNKFALNGISAKNLQHFFFLKSKNFLSLKSSESYPKKFSSKSVEKKIGHIFHISNRPYLKN